MSNKTLTAHLLAFLVAGGVSAQAASPATRPFTTTAAADITRLDPAPVAPKSAADLLTIQQRVQAIVKEALPATVAIRITSRGGTAEGSGVIVSKDGYVLTAGHVSSTPGIFVRLQLADGRIVRGRTLGRNQTIDSGMIKIMDPGEYPFVPMGTTASLASGQWIVAMGHPGGLQEGRPPVVRLGRVLARNGPHGFLQTDCEIIMGDSGGPVFDLDGRLIGINSRIGADTDDNLHTPVDTYIDTWDRLARGEVWGSLASAPAGGRATTGGTAMAGGTAAESRGARLGIAASDSTAGVRVNGIAAGTPAEDSGLRIGDIITQADGTSIKSLDDLSSVVGRHKAGDQITVHVLRAAQMQQISFKLAAKAGG